MIKHKRVIGNVSESKPRTRAYVVSVDDDAVSAIVWVTTSSTNAKVAALNTAWLGHCEYDDLECCREPKADGLRPLGYMICDEPTVEDTRLLRDLGWYEFDGSDLVCDSCDLSQWRDLPESQIGEDGICEQCRKLTNLNQEEM